MYCELDFYFAIVLKAPIKIRFSFFKNEINYSSSLDISSSKVLYENWNNSCPVPEIPKEFLQDKKLIKVPSKIEKGLQYTIAVAVFYGCSVMSAYARPVSQTSLPLPHFESGIAMLGPKQYYFELTPKESYFKLTPLTKNGHLIQRTTAIQDISRFSSTPIYSGSVENTGSSQNQAEEQVGPQVVEMDPENIPTALKTKCQNDLPIATKPKTPFGFLPIPVLKSGIRTQTRSPVVPRSRLVDEALLRQTSHLLRPSPGNLTEDNVLDHAGRFGNNYRLFQKADNGLFTYYPGQSCCINGGVIKRVANETSGLLSDYFEPKVEILPFDHDFTRSHDHLRGNNHNWRMFLSQCYIIRARGYSYGSGRQPKNSYYQNFFPHDFKCVMNQTWVEKEDEFVKLLREREFVDMDEYFTSQTLEGRPFREASEGFVTPHPVFANEDSPVLLLNVHMPDISVNGQIIQTKAISYEILRDLLEAPAEIIQQLRTQDLIGFLTGEYQSYDQLLHVRGIRLP